MASSGRSARASSQVASSFERSCDDELQTTRASNVEERVTLHTERVALCCKSSSDPRTTPSWSHAPQEDDGEYSTKMDGVFQTTSDAAPSDAIVTHQSAAQEERLGTDLRILNRSPRTSAIASPRHEQPQAGIATYERRRSTRCRRDSVRVAFRREQGDAGCAPARVFRYSRPL